ncbi:hypothetical protein [Halopseudomonas oceani]|uniref:Uncharacterized protein n=1 Tax=Halopseudomonas oceani TaxID=1708783 RepID=A0A2P4ES62_9GAMM|nr:hypothetical protein [Halopseudomonas oceani]POB01836.1 hypothetical protein C1949_15060 [Halopseudomonas oceani]
MPTLLKRLLVLPLLLIASLSHADPQQLQQLHEFRSEAFKAGTYLLIDNNLYERVREPGNREIYNGALQQMDSLLRQMNNPGNLRQLYSDFVKLIRELEDLPDGEEYYSLATVNRIMMAHGKLENAAAELYEAEVPGSPANLVALQRQSIDISRILLLYENNMFSSVGVYFLPSREGLFGELDTRISEGSNQLKQLMPDHKDTFDRLDKQYSFIQPRLINYHSDWVPTIAAFYLTKNTQTLDDLSREQASLAEASASTN